MVFGDYPETMRKIAGSRLPSFSSYESELVTNAFDFIGLNHYTSSYTSNHPNRIEGQLHDFTADLATLFRGPTFVNISLQDPHIPTILRVALFSVCRYKGCPPYSNGEMKNLLLPEKTDEMHLLSVFGWFL